MVVKENCSSASSSSASRTLLRSRSTNSEAHKKNLDSNSPGSSRFRQYRVYIPTISAFVKSKELRALALFYLLRHHYNHGRVYNLRGFRMANKLGISTHILRKYAKILEKYEFVKKVGGDYFLVNNDKIQEWSETKYKRHVIIDEFDTIQSIETKLKVAIIEDKVFKQQYILSARRDEEKARRDPMISLTKSQVKRIQKVRRKYNTSGLHTERIILSQRLLNRIAGVGTEEFKTIREFTSKKNGWEWHVGERVSFRVQKCIFDNLDVLNGYIRYCPRYIKNNKIVVLVPSYITLGNTNTRESQ